MARQAAGDWAAASIVTELQRKLADLPDAYAIEGPSRDGCEGGAPCRSVSDLDARVALKGFAKNGVRHQMPGCTHNAGLKLLGSVFRSFASEGG